MNLSEKLIITALLLITLTAFSYAGTKVYTNYIDLDQGYIENAQIYMHPNGTSTANFVDRPMFSQGNRTVVVNASGGGDYTSCQDALDDIPYYLSHEYNIRLGSDCNENLYFPPVMVMDSISETEGSVAALTFSSINTQKSVKSIHITNTKGAVTPYISNLKVTSNDPYSDENVSIIIYGSSHPSLYNINFTGSTARFGIIAYSSAITARNIDFGSTLERGAQTKHGGTIAFIDGFIKGTPTDTVFAVNGGGFIVFENNSASATNLVRCNDGYAYNAELDRLYCADNFESLNVLSQQTTYNVYFNISSDDYLKIHSQDGTAGILFEDSATGNAPSIRAVGNDLYLRAYSNNAIVIGNGKVGINMAPSSNDLDVAGTIGITDGVPAVIFYDGDSGLKLASYQGNIYLQNSSGSQHALNTGGNAGTDLCVDSNTRLCKCGQCS